MDRRPKSSGITLADLQNAAAEAHVVSPAKETRRYWAIKRQIAWEHRQKILAGQVKARKEGKRIGRPPVTALGERVYKMRQAGHTWKQISERFQRPMSTMFRRFDMYMREKGLSGASRQRLK